MGNEQSSQIDSAEESRNINGIESSTKSDDIEKLVVEKKNGTGEKDYTRGGTKLKNDPKSRARDRKSKKRKSAEASVEVLSQAEDAATLFSAPQTQKLQSQPWSFTAINSGPKDDIKSEIQPTIAKKEKTKSKKRREADERNQLPDPQENLPVKLGGQVSPQNDYIHRKRRGRLRKKQVLLEYAGQTLAPENQEISRSQYAILDVLEDVKPERTTSTVIKKKNSPLSPSEVGEDQFLDIDNAEVQRGENIQLVANSEQYSDTKSSRKAKSMRSRWPLSQIELEPGVQPDLANGELKPVQLLTPEATNDQLTPETNLNETAVAALGQLKLHIHLQDPQPNSLQPGTRNLGTLLDSDTHINSASELDIKRKRKNRKSLDFSSSSVTKKKRKRIKDKDKMDLTDEETFAAIMKTSSDPACSLSPEGQNSYIFSSPPPFVSYNGLKDKFQSMQDPTEMQMNVPAINDSHSALREQARSPYVASHSRFETKNGQNVPSSHKDYGFKLPGSFTPIRSSSDISQYRLVDSLDVAAYDTCADESATPMIGIYKNVNGVSRRKESLSRSGQENEIFLESDDAFRNGEVPGPFSSSKKKRRARTENDSVFDMEVIEEQQSRKTRSSLQSKASVKSTLKNPKTPKTTGKSSLSATLSTKSSPRASATTSKRRASMVLKNGRFDKEEIEIIAEEIVKYREAHNNMAQDELNNIIQDKAHKARQLWNQLSDALPDRSRQAIMKICRRRFHNYDSCGGWTTEDDEQLKDSYHIYPKQWKKIADLLNRHPDDIRDRWRNYLICGNNHKKDVWTENEEISLRVAVVECLEAIREIREQRPQILVDPQRSDMDFIDWQMVSQKLNHTRSRIQCLTKWKNIRKREDSENGEANDLELDPNSWRFIQARKSYPDMDSNDHLHLLYAIRHSQAGREGKIPFPKLGDDDFKRRWSCMVRKFAWKKMRATIPGNMYMKLQDIITLLIEHVTNDPEYLARHFRENGDRTPVSSHRASRKAKIPKQQLREKDIDEDEQLEKQNKIPYDTSWYDFGSEIKQLYSEDDEDLLYTDGQNSEALSIPESLILPQLNSSEDMMITGSPMPWNRAEVSRKIKKISQAFGTSPDDSDNEDIPARRHAKENSVEL